MLTLEVNNIKQLILIKLQKSPFVIIHASRTIHYHQSYESFFAKF